MWLVVYSLLVRRPGNPAISIFKIKFFIKERDQTMKKLTLLIGVLLLSGLFIAPLGSWAFDGELLSRVVYEGSGGDP